MKVEIEDQDLCNLHGEIELLKRELFEAREELKDVTQCRESSREHRDRIIELRRELEETEHEVVLRGRLLNDWRVKIDELRDELKQEKSRGDDLDAALEAERDMEINLEIVDVSSLDRLEKKIDFIGTHGWNSIHYITWLGNNMPDDYDEE